MPSSSGLSVKVGIFVVVGLILLIGFSLQVRQSSRTKDAYRITTYFVSAVGVEKDSEVTVGGVRAGEVVEMAFDAKRRKVAVTMAIQKDQKLPTDSVARIDKATLLGKSMIVIDYGAKDDAIAEGGELPAKDVPGLSEVASKIGEATDEVKKFISDFNENQDGILGDLKDMVAENREDIRSATKSMADAGPKLDKLAENLNGLVDDVKAGKGTMGKLFQDESLYTDLQSTTADLKQFAADVKDNNGTLHKLIYEDAIAKNAEDSFKKVGDAGDEIKTLLADNKDGIQKFMDAGPQIQQAAKDLSEISQKLKTNDGTLGKLINDPSLYNDAQRAVNQVNQSFESSEEQGVIRSFVGVLFGALI